MMVIESPLEVVEKLDAAFNRKDVDAVLEFYDDEAILVVEPGKCVSGKKALRKIFEKVFELNYIAEQEKMQVIESEEELALFISKWYLKSQNREEIIRESYATCVFRKNKDGKWRLAIDNSFGIEILNTPS